MIGNIDRGEYPLTDPVAISATQEDTVDLGSLQDRYLDHPTREHTRIVFASLAEEHELQEGVVVDLPTAIEQKI